MGTIEPQFFDDDETYNWHKQLNQDKRKGVASRHALISTSYGLPNIPYGNYPNGGSFL